MSRNGGKRRLRFRRRPRRGIDLVDAAGSEIVHQTGCCLTEAVVSASVLFALLLIPAALLLR